MSEEKNKEIYLEIDKLQEEIEVLLKERDIALATYNFETLTVLFKNILNINKRQLELMKRLACFLICLLLVGCARTKEAVYFNESQVILGDKAGVGVCEKFNYDCIVLSVGNFRNMTGVTPELGKKFKLIYE